MRKWMKVVLTLVAIGAAVSAVLVKLHLDKKRQEELDEFLLPDEDETVVVDVPVKQAQEEVDEGEFLA